MYVIDPFTAETPHGKFPWKNWNVLFLISFVPLDQIPKIKIWYIVASEHPEVIEGRQRLISKDVIDSDEAAEDFFIDNNGAALYEEDESGSGELVVISGVTQSWTEEV